MRIVGDRCRNLVGTEPDAQPAARPGEIASADGHRSSRDALGGAYGGNSGAKVYHLEIGKPKAFESMERALDVVIVPGEGESVAGIGRVAGAGDEESRAVISEDQPVIFQGLGDDTGLWVKRRDVNAGFQTEARAHRWLNGTVVVAGIRC